jgi:hypothetical protein
MPQSLSPADLVVSVISGALTKEWDFTKTLPDGTRATVRYRMQVLRAEENILALRAAQQFAKDMGELEGYGDIYREAQAYEVLQRAMRHADKVERGDRTSFYPPVFTSAAQLRASLTESEVAALLNAYTITKAEFGNTEEIGSVDADLWIARLSDPLRGPFFLSQCDSLQWPSLVYLLAGVCRDLFAECGRELPSLQPSLASGPENSTGATGFSGAPASASSTDGSVTVTSDSLLTKEQAAELLAKSKADKAE